MSHVHHLKLNIIKIKFKTTKRNKVKIILTIKIDM